MDVYKAPKSTCHRFVLLGQGKRNVCGGLLQKDPTNLFLVEQKYDKIFALPRSPNVNLTTTSTLKMFAIAPSVISSPYVSSKDNLYKYCYAGTHAKSSVGAPFIFSISLKSLKTSLLKVSADLFPSVKFQSK